MDRSGRMRQDRRAASRDALPIVAATALSALADRRTPDASALDDAPLANAHVRVLVVDADDDNVEATGRVLCTLGYDIGVSRNPRDALATALLLRPDLILCATDAAAEAALPQWVAELRDDPALRHTRLVALGAPGARLDRQASLRAGFDAWLTTPVELRQLETVLAALTQPSRAA